MFPWEAIHRAVGGNRKGVADRFGRSVTLIDKWCAAPKDFDGDGEHSPLERFVELVQAVRSSCGASSADGLVQYLLAELGYLPAIHSSDLGGTVTLVDVSAAVREFSEYLQSVGEAHSDGVLSLSEATRIESEISTLIQALAPQRQALLKLISSHEESQVRERIGPRRALPRLIQTRRTA